MSSDSRVSSSSPARPGACIRSPNWAREPLLRADPFGRHKPLPARRTRQVARHPEPKGAAGRSSAGVLEPSVCIPWIRKSKSGAATAAFQCRAAPREAAFRLRIPAPCPASERPRLLYSPWHRPDRSPGFFQCCRHHAIGEPARYNLKSSTPAWAAAADRQALPPWGRSRALSSEQLSGRFTGQFFSSFSLSNTGQS